MIDLYGADSCTECKIAKMWMQKTPIEFRYIDVSTIPGFEGPIPMLMTEDGRELVGMGQIKQYVNQKLSEMGY